MIAGDERVTIMREYGSARECQREAARLRRQGWEIVSVLDRPSTPGRLTPLMALPPPLRREPDREFLVTYVWRATTGRPVPPPPTSPRFGDRLMAAARRWWWVAVSAAVAVALAQGIVSFLSV